MRLRGVGSQPKWRYEEARHVVWNGYTRHDFRKEFERWGSKDLGAQLDDIQIIGEMRNGAAMSGVTENAWTALAVMTDAAQVPAGGIGEKHISTRVELCLGAALEPTAESGKAAQVEAISDRDEDVDILGARFGRQERAEDGNAKDARRAAGAEDELAREIQERGADLDDGMLSVLPNIVGNGS